jgi:exosome complex component RRP4
MAITILTPKPTPHIFGSNGKSRGVAADSDSDSDSSNGGVDLEGDVSMGYSAVKAKPSDEDADIVAPGELITDDPQWMR